MPTIEITAEQAAKLAAGENVTLTAPAPRKPVIGVCPGNGAVILVFEEETLPTLDHEKWLRAKSFEYIRKPVERLRRPNERTFSRSMWVFTEVAR